MTLISGCRADIRYKMVRRIFHLEKENATGRFEVSKTSIGAFGIAKDTLEQAEVAIRCDRKIPLQANSQLAGRKTPRDIYTNDAITTSSQQESRHKRAHVVADIDTKPALKGAAHALNVSKTAQLRDVF